MKPLTVISLVLIIFCMNNLIAAQNQDSSLFGKWQSVDVKKRMSTQLEFLNNNKVIFNQVLIADYKYVVKNNMLIDYIAKPYPQKGTIVDTSYFIAKQDTIIRWYNRGGWKDTVTMIRDKKYPESSGRKSNPFLGKWKWQYPTKDTAAGIFKNNGTWHFSLPQNIITGTYLIKKDTLEMNFGKKKNKQTGVYWTKGNLLELRDLSSNHQYLYRRIKDF